MPAPLPNLYCTPNDIFDQIGSEAAELRVDDKNLSSGQTITVTTAAALAATTLLVRALTSPLLVGASLNFDGAGLASVTQVVLSAVGKVGDTSLTVNPLPAAIPALANAFDSGVNVVQAARLMKGCTYGTSRVKLYCTPRYDDSQLARSWSANRWATSLGSQWVCRRRGQLPSKSVDAQAEEALEELMMVRTGVLNVEDIGTRTSGWPWISNITVNVGYDYAKARVESPLSELTPTVYPQYIDWNSAWVAGLEF